MTLPTAAEIEAADRDLASEVNYTLEIGLHILQSPRLRRACADMGRVAQRALPMHGPDVTVLQELVTSIFSTGLAYGLAIANQRVASVAGDLHPHYTSTYCIHGDHASCRRACKTCDAACRCACHVTAAEVSVNA